MIKRILLSLFLVVTLVQPAETSSRRFLVVFGGGQLGHQWWDMYDKDFYCDSYKWSDLDPFLKKVKQKIGNAPVLIDIDSHGAEFSHYLALEDQKDPKVVGDEEFDRATFGYVVSTVNKYFKPENVVMFTEACYSSACYKETIRGIKPNKYDKPVAILNYETVPKFPIYGAGNFPNWDNGVYAQYKHGLNISMIDLRKYETEPLPPQQERTIFSSLINTLVWMCKNFFYRWNF